MAVEMGRALARMSSDLPELIPLSTSYPAIANAPLPAEGSASFSNIHLAIAVLAVPWIFTKLLPFRTGWTSYFILTALLFLPVTGGYWIFMSKYGERINEKVPLPGRPLDHYIELKSLTMRQWEGKMIPMQIFHDAFFDGKAEFKGDVLEVMEYRHEWASFEFTMEVRLHISSISGSCQQLFRFVFTNLIPEVIIHSQSQDEEQVRDHYDRGDDFYSWFLGPRMVYTSGVISDINRMETLEELQDNKLTMVCEKLNLQMGDRMLDIGSGWGTLCTHAAKNYWANVTGGRSPLSPP
jgi:hypothetical protein